MKLRAEDAEDAQWTQCHAAPSIPLRPLRIHRVLCAKPLYCAVQPPSIESVVPVTVAAASLAR